MSISAWDSLFFLLNDTLGEIDDSFDELSKGDDNDDDNNDGGGVGDESNGRGVLICDLDLKLYRAWDRGYGLNWRLDIVFDLINYNAMFIGIQFCK